MCSSGLLAKLESFEISGGIFSLFGVVHLKNRQLRVVLNGRRSKYHKIGASVEKKSVPVSFLWNILFNSLLAWNFRPML